MSSAAVTAVVSVVSSVLNGPCDAAGNLAMMALMMPVNEVLMVARIWLTMGHRGPAVI